MSKVNVEKFYELVKEDKDLRESLEKIDKRHGEVKEDNLAKLVKAEIIPLAKTKGLNFTAEEFMDYLEDRKKLLSREELLNVSGGISPRKAAIGLSGALLLSFGTGAAMQLMDFGGKDAPESQKSSVTLENEKKQDDKETENAEKQAQKKKMEIKKVPQLTLKSDVDKSNTTASGNEATGQKTVAAATGAQVRQQAEREEGAIVPRGASALGDRRLRQQRMDSRDENVRGELDSEETVTAETEELVGGPIREERSARSAEKPRVEATMRKGGKDAKRKGKAFKGKSRVESTTKRALDEEESENDEAAPTSPREDVEAPPAKRLRTDGGEEDMKVPASQRALDEEEAENVENIGTDEVAAFASPREDAGEQGVPVMRRMDAEEADNDEAEKLMQDAGKILGLTDTEEPAQQRILAAEEAEDVNKTGTDEVAASTSPREDAEAQEEEDRFWEEETRLQKESIKRLKNEEDAKAATAPVGGSYEVGDGVSITYESGKNYVRIKDTRANKSTPIKLNSAKINADVNTLKYIYCPKGTVFELDDAMKQAGWSGNVVKSWNPWGSSYIERSEAGTNALAKSMVQKHNINGCNFEINDDKVTCTIQTNKKLILNNDVIVDLMRGELFKEGKGAFKTVAEIDANGTKEDLRGYAEQHVKIVVKGIDVGDISDTSSIPVTVLNKRNRTTYKSVEIDGGGWLYNRNGEISCTGLKSGKSTITFENLLEVCGGDQTNVYKIEKISLEFEDDKAIPTAYLLDSQSRALFKPEIDSGELSLVRRSAAETLKEFGITEKYYNGNTGDLFLSYNPVKGSARELIGDKFEDLAGRDYGKELKKEIIRLALSECTKTEVVRDDARINKVANRGIRMLPEGYIKNLVKDSKTYGDIISACTFSRSGTGVRLKIDSGMEPEIQGQIIKYKGGKEIEKSTLAKLVLVNVLMKSRDEESVQRAYEILFRESLEEVEVNQ